MSPRAVHRGWSPEGFHEACALRSYPQGVSPKGCTVTGIRQGRHPWGGPSSVSTKCTKRTSPKWVTKRVPPIRVPKRGSKMGVPQRCLPGEFPKGSPNMVPRGSPPRGVSPTGSLKGGSQRVDHQWGTPSKFSKGVALERSPKFERRSAVGKRVSPKFGRPMAFGEGGA